MWVRVMFGRIAAAALGALAALTVAASGASAGTTTTYKVGCCATLGQIRAGPDGALWFTEAGANRIGRITTSGAITTFPVPTANAGLGSITPGPDGRLWFTEIYPNQIGAITPSGTVTEYPAPAPYGCTSCGGPDVIASGPDGRVWFTVPGANDIAAMTTAGTETLYPISGVPSGDVLSISAMTSGPDGRVWFSGAVQDASSQAGLYDVIGAVTAAGAVTFYRIPYTALAFYPGGIAAGHDGRLWFGDRTLEGVGAITTSGTQTSYSLPIQYNDLTALTAGPDGRVWVTDGASYGAITPSGAFTGVTPTPPNGDVTGLIGIAGGSDGRIWMTDVLTFGEGGAEVGDQILAVTTSGGGGGGTHTKHPSCIVPKLKGKTVSAARKALSSHHCRLGAIGYRRTKGKRGRVLAQSAKPGSKHSGGFAVGVTVSGTPPKAHKRK